MDDTHKTTPLLILIPSVQVYQQADGKQFITQKFLDGVNQYKSQWPGEIEVYIEQSHQPDSNLDKISIDQINQFTITIMDFDSIEKKLSSITRPTIVLASIHYKQNAIANKCQTYNIPCVQTSEYTLNTRLQIIKANRKNLLKRWRGYLWEYQQEKKNIESIRQSSAVQCNGLPTYNIYKNLNSNCLLYFDSRVRKEDVIDKKTLEKRTQNCLEGKALRLVFSGRLNAMKGADHLVLFAKALRELGVNFDLTICGDGDLFNTIEQSIQQWGLSKQVKLTGVLDFHSELLPFVKTNADIFICCHRQGDPSCTYIETMSCAVPIVSYDNEAFVGLQDTCKSGWTIPMDNYELMAKQIKKLDKNRQDILEHSIKAREFAIKHTFEITFAKRIDHLKSIYLNQKK